MEGTMEKLTMKQGEVRALHFGISQIIGSGVKDSNLKYGLSRCKKALQPAVESLDETENSDEGIKAYREELKAARVVDELGKIIDKKAYSEITEKHRETLDKNRDWLRTGTEVDIYKIAHECTSEISSDLYDLIFPIILEPKAEGEEEKEAA
jgi:hypothetical protein